MSIKLILNVAYPWFTKLVEHSNTSRLPLNNTEPNPERGLITARQRRKIRLSGEQADFV